MRYEPGGRGGRCGRGVVRRHEGRAVLRRVVQVRRVRWRVRRGDRWRGLPVRRPSFHAAAARQIPRQVLVVLVLVGVVLLLVLLQVRVLLPVVDPLMSVVRPVHGGVPVRTELRRRHPLLLLPPVAEPHPHHLFLQLEAVRQCRDLLRRRLRVLVEVLLQRALDADLDGGPLLPLPALRRDLVYGGRGAGGGVRLRQPLLEQRHQLAHVLEAELERLEPADGGLGEDVAVEGAERQPHVRLGEAQLDPPLLELLGEGLQVV